MRILLDALRRPIKLITLLVLLIHGSASRAEPVAINVAYLPLVGVAPLFVMQEEGWLAKAGFSPQLTRFNSGAAIVQATASGKFDAVYMAVSPVLVAHAAGADLKVIATNDHEPMAFVVTKALAGAYSGAANPAAAFKAFVEKEGRPAKIAVLAKGTMPDTAIRYYIESRGIDPNAIQIISQSEEAVRQSVLIGAADGAVMPQPIIAIVESKVPGSRVVADGKALMPNHPGFVLAVRQSFLEKNPGAAEKLAALNVRAVNFVKQNPPAAIKHIDKFLGGLIDQEILLKALNSPYGQPLTDPARLVEGTKTLQDYQIKIGVQKAPVALDAFFYTPLFPQARK